MVVGGVVVEFLLGVTDAIEGVGFVLLASFFGFGTQQSQIIIPTLVTQTVRTFLGSKVCSGLLKEEQWFNFGNF